MAERRKLTHLDESGRARMVDVSAKRTTLREAEARATVVMAPETLDLILSGGLPKGDVFTVAQVAAIMAAKRTPDLIPMCHPLPLSDVSVGFTAHRELGEVEIAAVVKCAGQTGVEMEALTAAAVAALTIYDMCKAVDRGMRMRELRLVRKSGGRSGEIVLER